MKNLTERQREILIFIKEEVLYKNYPPSVREICTAIGLRSSSTVHAHLRALEKKGYIKRDPTKPRAIELIQSESGQREEGAPKMVPIVGQVAAGVPLLAEENIERYMLVSEEIVKNDTVFMLHVKGESMKDAGILHGDLVIVRKQPSAENGEIVVALTEENEATVKRFYREDGFIRLQPENPDYSPLITRNNVQVLGKVIGVLRLIE